MGCEKSNILTQQFSTIDSEVLVVPVSGCWLSPSTAALVHGFSMFLHVSTVTGQPFPRPLASHPQLHQLCFEFGHSCSKFLPRLGLRDEKTLHQSNTLIYTYIVIYYIEVLHNNRSYIRNVYIYISMVISSKKTHKLYHMFFWDSMYTFPPSLKTSRLLCIGIRRCHFLHEVTEAAARHVAARDLKGDLPLRILRMDSEWIRWFQGFFVCWAHRA